MEPIGFSIEHDVDDSVGGGDGDVGERGMCAFFFFIPRMGVRNPPRPIGHWYGKTIL